MIERFEPCQQTVNLEAVRQFQHVADDARLNLWNIDGILFLKNASFHAVVADTVSGARTHGVIEHDHRQRRDRLTPLAQLVHFGNPFLERAARERNAERIALVVPVRIAKSVRARILFTRMANDAVVDLSQVFLAAHARVGQAKAVTQPPVLGGTGQSFRQLVAGPFDLHQVPEIDLCGTHERHPAADLFPPERIGVHLHAPHAERPKRLALFFGKGRLDAMSADALGQSAWLRRGRRIRQ